MSEEVRRLILLFFLIFSSIFYSQKSPLEIKALGKIESGDKLKIELKNISKDTLKLLGNLYLDSRTFSGLKTSGFDYSYIKNCEDNKTSFAKVAEQPRNFGEFDEKLIILEPNSSHNIIVWIVGGERICGNPDNNKLKIMYKVELCNDFAETYKKEKNNFSEKIKDFERKFSNLKNKSSVKDFQELSYLMNDLIRTKKILEGFENLEIVASQHLQAETEYIQF